MATATRKCPKGNNVTDQSEDPTPMTPIDPSCSDCTTVVIGQNPELTLQKEGTFTDENSDGPAQVGETFTYTITQAAIDAGDVDNMATATRKCPKGNNVTDQSEDPTPMTPIDPSCSDCTTVVTGQNPELTFYKKKKHLQMKIVMDLLTYVKQYGNSYKKMPQRQ